MANALRKNEAEDMLKVEGQARAKLAEHGQFNKIGWWAADDKKKNFESVLKKEGVLGWARENTASVAEIIKRVISDEKWGSGRVGFKKIISEIKAEAKEAAKEEKPNPGLAAIPKKEEKAVSGEDKLDAKMPDAKEAKKEIPPELQERVAKITRTDKLYSEATEAFNAAKKEMSGQKAEAAIAKAKDAKAGYYDLGWFDKAKEAGKFIENAESMLPAIKYAKMNNSAEAVSETMRIDKAEAAPLEKAGAKTKDLAAEAKSYIEKLKTLSGDERADAAKKITVQLKPRGQLPETMTLEEYMIKTDSMNGGFKLPLMSRFGGNLDENKLAGALERDSKGGINIFIKGEGEYSILGV